MVNSGSYDTSGAEGESVKAEFTQLEDDAVPRHFVTACASEASYTAVVPDTDSRENAYKTGDITTTTAAADPRNESTESVPIHTDSPPLVDYSTRLPNRTTSVQCSVPLDKVRNVLELCRKSDPKYENLYILEKYLKQNGNSSTDSSPPESVADSTPKPAVKRLLCLFCDRTFTSNNLKQKHVDRCHSVGQTRRSSSRTASHNQSATACCFCNKLNHTDHTLKQLLEHLINEHSNRYFACLPCQERFSAANALREHNSVVHDIHQEEAVVSEHKPSARDAESDPLEVSGPVVTSSNSAQANSSPPNASKRNASKNASSDDNQSKQNSFQVDFEDTIHVNVISNETDTIPEETEVKVEEQLPKKKSKSSSANAKSKSSGKKNASINKKITVKSTKNGVRNNLRTTRASVKQMNNFSKNRKNKLVKSEGDEDKQTVSKRTTLNSSSVFSLVNAYTYKYEKIYDHSSDSIKDASSLQFNAIFDREFYTRTVCNIRENLLNHLDGKLNRNVESESRISNFEHNPSTVPIETEVKSANKKLDHFGCNLSLNAVTPVATLLGSSQYGEDFDSQIEYGAKASQKKPKKVTIVKYKFTNKKYNSLYYEKDPHSDLTCLDMWTQLTVKKRQHKCHFDDDEYEIDTTMYHDHISGHCTAKHQVEELNRILDKRGPFEDLRLEANAANLLELRKKSNISEESLKVVDNILEEILNRVVFQSDNNVIRDGQKSNSNTELMQSTSTSTENEVELDENMDIPNYLQLHRSPAETNVIDKTDTITIICSSQDEGNEKVRLELSGEWARPRIYICASCGLKLPNLKALEDHKNTSHPHIWCSHYEFVGKQSEIYKHLSIPGLGKVGIMETLPANRTWQKSDARVCTKCTKQCQHLGELHKHMLECGGDWTWMLARKKCKYRPYGARSRRRRQRGYKRSCNPELSSVAREHKPKIKSTFIGPRPKPSKPSDAETIERMLANLPPKRNRKVISMRDGIQRPRKPYKQRIVSPNTPNKQSDTVATNTSKKIKFKNNSSQINAKQNLRSTIKRKISAQKLRNQNNATATQSETLDDTLKLRSRAPKTVTNETKSDTDITQQLIGNKNKIRNQRMISRILGSKIFDSSSALVTRRRLVKAITQNNLIRKTRLRTKNLEFNTQNPDSISENLINEEQVPVKGKNTHDNKKTKSAIKTQCSANENDTKTLDTANVYESETIVQKNVKKSNGKRLLSVLTKSNKKTKNVPENTSVSTEKKTDNISAAIDAVVKMAYKDDYPSLEILRSEVKPVKKTKKTNPIKKSNLFNKIQETTNAPSFVVTNNQNNSGKIDIDTTPVSELIVTDTKEPETESQANAKNTKKKIGKKTNKFVQNLKSIRKSMKKNNGTDKTEGIATKLMRTLSIRGSKRKKKSKNNKSESITELNLIADTNKANTEIQIDVNINDKHIPPESDIEILKNSTTELSESLHMNCELQALPSDLESIPVPEIANPLPSNVTFLTQLPQISIPSPILPLLPTENNSSDTSKQVVIKNEDTTPEMKIVANTNSDKILNSANNALNKFKSKIKRSGRGLNDCIAMLKCKLEQKYQGNDTPFVDKSKLLILNSPTVYNNTNSDIQVKPKVQIEQISSSNIVNSNTNEISIITENAQQISVENKVSVNNVSVLEIPSVKNQPNHVNKSTSSEMSTVETQTLSDLTLETSPGFLRADIPVNSQINFVLNAAMKNCLMECVKSKCEKLKIENQHFNVTPHFNPNFKDRKIGSIRKRKRRINNAKSDKKVTPKHIPNVPVVMNNNTFIENSSKKDVGCSVIDNRTLEDASDDDIPLSKLAGSSTSHTTTLKIKLPVDKKKRRTKKKTEIAPVILQTQVDRVPQVSLEEKLEQHVALDNSINSKIETIQAEVATEKSKKRKKRDKRNTNASTSGNKPSVINNKANSTNTQKKHETREEILSDISKYVNIIKQCEKLNFNTIVANYEVEIESNTKSNDENVTNSEIVANDIVPDKSGVTTLANENSSTETEQSVRQIRADTSNEKEPLSTNTSEDQCDYISQDFAKFNCESIEELQTNMQNDTSREENEGDNLQTIERAFEEMSVTCTTKQNESKTKERSESNNIDTINLNEYYENWNHESGINNCDKIGNENDIHFETEKATNEDIIQVCAELNDISTCDEQDSNTVREQFKNIPATITEVEDSKSRVNDKVSEKRNTFNEELMTDKRSAINDKLMIEQSEIIAETYMNKNSNELEIDKLEYEGDIAENENKKYKEDLNKISNELESVVDNSDQLTMENTENECEKSGTGMDQNEKINGIKNILDMLNPLSQQIMSVEDEPNDNYMLNKTLTEANIEPSITMKHNQIYSTSENAEATKSNYVDNGKENSQEKSIYKKIKKHKKSAKKLKNKRRAKTKLKIILPKPDNYNQISEFSSKLDEGSNYEDTPEIFENNQLHTEEEINTNYTVQIHLEAESEEVILENKNILQTDNQSECNEIVENNEEFVQNLSSSDSEDELPLAHLVKKNKQNDLAADNTTNINISEDNLNNQINEISNLDQQIVSTKEIEELYDINHEKELYKSNDGVYNVNEQDILNISEEMKSININKSSSEEIDAAVNDAAVNDAAVNDLEPDSFLQDERESREMDLDVNIRRLLTPTNTTERQSNETEDAEEVLQNTTNDTELANPENEILVEKSEFKIDNILKSPNSSEKTCEEVFDFLKTPTNKPVVSESEFITTPDLNDGSLVIKIKKNLKVRIRKSKKSRKRVIPKSLNKNNVKRKEENTSIFCDICNKTFKRKENLTSHKKTLTHIAKLSEIEARENLARREAEVEENSEIPAEPEENNEVPVEAEENIEVPVEIEENNEVPAEIKENTELQEEDSKIKDKETDITEDINIVEDNCIEDNENLEENLDDPVVEIISIESPKPIQNLLPGIIVNSSHSNLKLVDIINEVLDKPVNDLNITDSNYLHRNMILPKKSEVAEKYPEPKRYKSLGERKSFDSDNFAIPQKCTEMIPINDNYNAIQPVHNGLLSKQLSLLENIIEETSPNLNYIEDSISLSSSQFDEPLVEQNMPEKDLFRASEYTAKLNDPQIKFSHSSNVIASYIKPNSFNHFENISDTFVKPINHYEEVSQPQFDEEDLKKKDNSTRKILNRDEELFLECCSLLKSGSEISGTTKKSTKHITLNSFNEINNSNWIQEKQVVSDRYVQREPFSWLAQGSRVNTPIGEPFVNNDWSNSNSAISSEWLAQKAPSPDRPIESNTLPKKNNNIPEVRYADIQFEDISLDDSIDTSKTLMAGDIQNKNILLDFHNVDFSNDKINEHAESSRDEENQLEIEENNDLDNDFEENKLEDDESKLDAEESKLEDDESKLDAEESKLEADENKLDTGESSKLEADESKMSEDQSKLDDEESKLDEEESKLHEECKLVEEESKLDADESKIEEDDEIIAISDEASNIDEPKTEETITAEKEEVNNGSQEDLPSNEFDADLKKKVVSAFGGLMAKALSNRLHAVVRKSKKSRLKRELASPLQLSIADYTVPIKKNKLDTPPEADSNDCRKKLITKGAMKIFEGLKVSIPTQDLNLTEVLNGNKKSKNINSAKTENLYQPNEEKVADKVLEPPVKNGKIKKLFSRFGNKLGLRETKKKQNKHRSSGKNKNHIHKEKPLDVYDFEESLDNNFTLNNVSFPHFRSIKENMEKNEDIYGDKNKDVEKIDKEYTKKSQNEHRSSLNKWNIESDSDTDRYYDSMSFEEVSFSSESTAESNAVMKIKQMHKKNSEKSKENQKKCMIMGRIFKNASKPKLEDKIPEIRDFNSEENSKLAENYLDSCSSIDNVDNNVHYENISPVPNNLTIVNSANKMTKKEMDLLFDKLLEEEQKNIINNQLKSAINDVAQEEVLKHVFVEANNQETNRKSDKTKIKPVAKVKKRQRHNSEKSNTSDEFVLHSKHTNSSKKRHKSQRKSSKNKKDGGINLEQEIKECIGVAGRKSQRKCTSGKQNVLVEFWSSDETTFEEEATADTNNVLENNDTAEISHTEQNEDLINTNSASNSISLPESKSEVVEENRTKNLDVYDFDSDLDMNVMGPPSSKLEMREYSTLHKIKLPRKNPRPKQSRSRKHSRNHDSEDTEYEGEKSRRKNEHRKKRNLENESDTNTDCLAVSRKKRNAGEMLYYWSSSSDDEFQDLIEIKPIREDTDDDRPMQHGWIVGDSPKKLVTMLAQAKGKKIDGGECVKEQGKKNRVSL